MMFKTLLNNFMGESPKWYKITIALFLLINPLLFLIAPFATGWLLIVEFIFVLAMALKCYPLPPAGLLAMEAVMIGMTTPETVYHEVADNLPVLLLLMFMVAGIHFMKEGLLTLFTKILLNLRSKTLLAFLFCALGAFLSAFLDALTVIAVVMSVIYGFYGVYHQYISDGAEIRNDTTVKKEHEKDLAEFRGFLRNLIMHAAVGTTLGGALTLVGEPQNLLIGEKMGWHFGEFFLNCAVVSVPTAIIGLITCVLLEVVKFPGYGYQLPNTVFEVLKKSEENFRDMDQKKIARLIVQALVGCLLILALAFHIAEVGFIGLAVIILLTTFNGVIEEDKFGEAFHAALPFTALLVVFFAIIGVIHDQQLFKPILEAAFAIEGQGQLLAMFAANGLLSAVSDNVFVATIYITETATSFNAGAFDREWFNKLAVVINMGTNIPSVATPNGQAAFLFLLTSSLAPLIRLSYMEMVKLALPYTIVMTTVSALCVIYWL